jgi:hypothetical protein
MSTATELSEEEKMTMKIQSAETAAVESADSTRVNIGSLHLLRFSLALLSSHVLFASKPSTDTITCRCICGDMDHNTEKDLNL